MARTSTGVRQAVVLAFSCATAQRMPMQLRYPGAAPVHRLAVDRVAREHPSDNQTCSKMSESRESQGWQIRLVFVRTFLTGSGAQVQFSFTLS